MKTQEIIQYGYSMRLYNTLLYTRT